jgi:hypothetical protein
MYNAVEFAEIQVFCLILLHAGFFVGVLFDPEDSGCMILVNGDWLWADYTALCSRRYCHVYGVRVTYKTVFWIGWLDLLTAYTNNLELQALQRYR